MIGSAILLLCTNLATSHDMTKVACTKASQATAIQTGNDKKFNSYANQKQKNVVEYVGKNNSAVMATAYVLLIKKQVDFRISDVPYGGSANIGLAPEKATIRLTWSF